jgi:hypothetical protein
MEEKREGDRETAEEVFLASDPLYHWFFGIGDGKKELLKLLLVRARGLAIAVGMSSLRVGGEFEYRRNQQPGGSRSGAFAQ